MRLGSKLIIMIITLSLGLCVREAKCENDWANVPPRPQITDNDGDDVLNVDDHCRYDGPYTGPEDGRVHKIDGCTDTDGDGIRDQIGLWGVHSGETCGSLCGGLNSSDEFRKTVDHCPDVIGIGIDVKLSDVDDETNGTYFVDKTTPAIPPSNIANGCADWNCDGLVNREDSFGVSHEYINKYTESLPEKRIIRCPKSYTANPRNTEDELTTYTSEYQCWWKIKRDENGNYIDGSGYIYDNDCDGIEDAPPGVEPGGIYDNCEDRPGSRRQDTGPDQVKLRGCPEPAFQVMLIVESVFSALSESLQRDESEFEHPEMAIDWDRLRDMLRADPDPEPAPEPTPPPTPRRETPSPAPRTPSTTTPPTSTTTTQPTNFYREGELDTSDEENTVRTDDTNGDASNESYGGCSLVDGTAKSGGLSLIFLALSLLPIVIRRKGV